MSVEDELHENIRKVIGIPEKWSPAQTASGMQMMAEDPLARIRHEAEMFLRAVDGNKGSDRFRPEIVVWLMVAFTQHLWKRQELMRKAYDTAMNSKMDVTVSLPALEPSEAQFIKHVVAEAIGSQDVDYQASAAAAVQKLRDAYKRALGPAVNRFGDL